MAFISEPEFWRRTDNRTISGLSSLSERNIVNMKTYVCTICNYKYEPKKGDPDGGVAPGVAFDALPDDWACPLCGAGKDFFEPEE